MTDEPESPSDPRPNGEPYYIDSTCDTCGAELVLYDSLDDEQLRQSDKLADPEFQDDDGDVWHDEWCCPNCLDGVYLDWPEWKGDILVDDRMDDEFEEFDPE